MSFKICFTFFQILVSNLYFMPILQISSIKFSILNCFFKIKYHLHIYCDFYFCSYGISIVGEHIHHSIYTCLLSFFFASFLCLFLYYVILQFVLLLFIIIILDTCLFYNEREIKSLDAY